MVNSKNNTYIITTDQSQLCQDITVGMATQPHREQQMLKVVKQLLPQCTRICISLNNYDYVPAELQNNSKIIYILTGKSSVGVKYNIEDLGAQNKMYWLGTFPGYYASVDDDLNYPDNYLLELKKNIIKYKYKAICSFHGMIHEVHDGILVDPAKKRYFWKYDEQHIGDHQCHRIGMGVAMSYPSKIGLTRYPYLSMPKNYGDDQITSVWAQIYNIPLMCVDNTNVKITATKLAFNGLYRNKEFREIRNMYMTSYHNWTQL